MGLCSQFSHHAVFARSEIRGLLKAQARVKFKPVCCSNQGQPSEKPVQARFSINPSQMCVLFFFSLFLFLCWYLSRKANKRKRWVKLRKTLTRWIVWLVTHDAELRWSQWLFWKENMVCLSISCGIDHWSLCGVRLKVYHSCGVVVLLLAAIRARGSVGLIIDWAL